MKITLVLLSVVGTILFFTSCIKTVTEQELFHPEKYPELPDEDLGRINRRNISIKISDSVTIKGWLLKHKKSKDWLIYFYGNGETVFESRSRLYYLADTYGLNIVSFDYRGYGYSNGTPSFDVLLSDSLIIYGYIKKQYAAGIDSVFVYGHSIGTVPALHLALNRKISGLILEAAFTTASEAIPEMSKGMPWPMNWLIRLKPEKKLEERKPQQVDKIKALSAPLLSIHATLDEYFPLSMGKEMYNTAGSKEKYFCRVEGAGHNTVNLNKPPVYTALKKFINRYR